MPKYEIMVILDPKAESSVLENLFSVAFGQNSTKKLQKLEQTNLAYPIRKSQTAQYFLADLEIEPNLIEEFIRRANITKSIWRFLIINLDSEKGFGKKPKQRPNRVWKQNQTRENSTRPYSQNPKFNRQGEGNNQAAEVEKAQENRGFRNNYNRPNSQQANPKLNNSRNNDLQSSEKPFNQSNNSEKAGEKSTEIVKNLKNN